MTGPECGKMPKTATMKIKGKAKLKQKIRDLVKAGMFKRK